MQKRQCAGSSGRRDMRDGTGQSGTLSRAGTGTGGDTPPLRVSLSVPLSPSDEVEVKMKAGCGRGQLEKGERPPKNSAE
jgi:hypothetical protein